MGIQGLLPLLKSIMVPIHVKDLRGCRVAIDTYSWLHKGALSCSKELCKGEPTTRHIVYCMHRVNLLRHHGVTPILVFDGGLLPMKGEQEAKRHRSRKENLERAIEHESTGNSSAAFECYQKAVDISPSIANELIQVLKQENVDYIVAPYEADAQMTFLALSKQVDAVITEDSDLIPFGCPRIIFKMDKFGQGVQFEYSMLHQNKDLKFSGFTKQMLLEMCILSGCDYLQSLPGMGLKRAHALICKFKSYEKVIKHLRYNVVSVPPLYEDSFKKALWTFQHQRVFDPITEDIVHLSDVPDDHGQDLEFLGPMMPKDIATGIARGDIDPMTKAPFQGKIVHTGLVLDRKQKLKESKPERERKKPDLPAQKNVLTNYFCSASLEAKKKFKAPRIIPKNLDSTDESSPSTQGNASQDFGYLSTSCSQGSLLDSGNTTGSSPFKDSLEDGFVTHISPSFDSPGYMELDGMNDGADDLKILQHSVFFAQPKSALHKPCMTLHKKQESKFASEQAAEKTRLANRKVIVRSSYFQHNLLKENDLENENGKPTREDDVGTGTFSDEAPCESAPNSTNYIKATATKKRSISTEMIQNEGVQVKCARKNASLSNECTATADIGYTSEEINTDRGNFGCNISHLSHFSDVAEKSMERFISVISSFKCASSGSRASGLRAPLKDVRNTLTVKPTSLSTDISKFAYRPNSKKIASGITRD